MAPARGDQLQMGAQQDDLLAARGAVGDDLDPPKLPVAAGGVDAEPSLAGGVLQVRAGTGGHPGYQQLPARTPHAHDPGRHVRHLVGCAFRHPEHRDPGRGRLSQLRGEPPLMFGDRSSLRAAPGPPAPDPQVRGGVQVTDPEVGTHLSPFIGMQATSCTKYMYSVHDVSRGPGLSIHYCQTGRATRNLNPAARSPRSIRRLRHRWAAQVLVGWAVTPRMCTARARTSMTKKTHRRRSHDARRDPL